MGHKCSREEPAIEEEIRSPNHALSIIEEDIEDDRSTVSGRISYSEYTISGMTTPRSSISLNAETDKEKLSTEVPNGQNYLKERRISPGIKCTIASIVTTDGPSRKTSGTRTPLVEIATERFQQVMSTKRNTSLHTHGMGFTKRKMPSVEENGDNLLMISKLRQQLLQLGVYSE